MRDAQELIAELKDQYWLNLSKAVQLAIIRFENEGSTSRNIGAFRDEGFTEIADAIDKEKEIQIRHWIDSARNASDRRTRIAILKEEHGDKYQ
jgi:hypothetical protein